MSNAKNTVLTAAGELFGQKDPSAVDRWVAMRLHPAQHSGRRRPRGLAASWSRACRKASATKAPE